MRLPEVLKEIVRSNADAWNTIEMPDGRMVYSCEMNTNIRIEYYQEGPSQREYNVEWANKLGDDPILDRPYYLFYGSSPVRQFSAAIVDNGSTVVPVMGANTGRLSDVEYRIAQILTQDDERLDANIEYAGISIEEPEL